MLANFTISREDHRDVVLSATHQRGKSWSGSLTDLLLLGRQKPSHKRQKSLDEEKQSFHEQNQRFLHEQHQKYQGMTHIPIVAFRSAPSPSGRMHHKRLPSIDEGGCALLPIPLQDDDPIGEGRMTNGVPIATTMGNASSSPSSSFSSSGSGSGSSSSWCSHVEAERMEQNNNIPDLEDSFVQKIRQALNKNEDIMTEIEKNEFIQNYMSELEREHQSLLEKWKQEWEEEHRCLQVQGGDIKTRSTCGNCFTSMGSVLATAEVFAANLPLTIGVLGLSWVTMGSVWFKFMEEMSSTCRPVHFFSPGCVFPEFPGCFECDVSQRNYKVALYWHYTCSTFSGLFCILFLLKVVIGRKVVVDELSNPTTSTPMGVVCIAMECVFAGRGFFGEIIVISTSYFHFFWSGWFLYMAVVRFGLWPDPGWFPNTVGLAYGAVKTFLYFPRIGLFFLTIAVVFFLSIFFISVARVALNKKMAAPVAWIILSAPSIIMYALTLVTQPTHDEELMLESNTFLNLKKHEMMAKYYLPAQHFMMCLSLLGLVSAVSSLVVRWESFSKKPFSPAHVAFCFPTLSHTNALQAYRGAVNAYSTIPAKTPFKVALFVYWVFFLIAGTILNLVFTYLYIQRLPRWTKLDVADEEEPPAPDDTFVHEMLESTEAHELLDQPFMNPAVLQANEAGVLIRVPRGSEDYRRHGPYARTRRVAAFGFDPTMGDEEFRQERAQLLDWLAKNAPRRRHRTMSNPSILHRRQHPGQYGSFGRRHKRSMTATGI